MLRKIFGWPFAMLTLATLSVCTVLVYVADAIGYWGMPFDMVDMADMKIIYVTLPVLVCFELNFMTVDAYTKQRAAIRTLPLGAKRIGSILWVQTVLLAPVWILVTCAPLLFHSQGATPPPIFQISFLGLACGAAMTTVWVAASHVDTSPSKRTRTMGLALIAVAAVLIVLVVLAALGRLSSYWLAPLVVALVGHTWVQRETLAHMNPKMHRPPPPLREALAHANPKMNWLRPPFREAASPGGSSSRRAAPAGMGQFIVTLLINACVFAWMMWMLYSEYGLDLLAMWLMPGMFLGQCVVSECKSFRTMRLVPVTSGQLLARTAARFYTATGVMIIVAVCVSWTRRGTFSWTPVAAVAAGAGAALFVTVWNLKPGTGQSLGRSFIVGLLGISMAAMAVGMAGLLPPEGYYPVALPISAFAALVLNPLGLLLLYRAIDRGSSVYRPVDYGLNVLGQPTAGGRL